MKIRLIEHGKEARKKLLSGISKLSQTVRTTLGPKGRNAIIERPLGMYPTVTNDGVSIAREVFLEDPFENMGALLVKSVSMQTNDVAGDGTTTATILAEAMIKSGLKYIEENKVNPMLVKKGMMDAKNQVIEALTKMSKPVDNKEQMKQVATISSQNAEVGELIGEVFDKVGEEGIVQVEEGSNQGFEIEMKDGLNFDTGLLSPYFLTDPARMEGIYEDFYILVTDKMISNATELIPLMTEMAKAKKPNLLIIAPDIKGNALQTLVANYQQQAFNCVGIKAPEFGDRQEAMLQDIAVMVGAEYISEKVGRELAKTTIDDLGKAVKVISNRDETTIIEGAGDKEKIKTRQEQIKSQVEACKMDFEKERLQTRLARLTGGVAIIKVGAATEVEQKEQKHRIEDALNATRAAMEEGIIIGGGAALLQVSRNIIFSDGDEAIGQEIVQESLSIPLLQIAENAGEDGVKILDELLNKWDIDKNIGYDANSPLGDPLYVDMFKAGIVDPKKVTRSALENAVSIAAMYLTTETALVEKPKKDESNT